MNISELRIGNYYQKEHLEGFERWGVVEDVDFFRSSDELEAIKLTPEIMVLFGFEKIHNNIWQKRTKADRVLNLEEADGYIQHYVGFGVSESSYNMVHIHVHRLQNLYHALTGEELTLNKAL
jgi:hypothetical protein